MRRPRSSSGASLRCVCVSDVDVIESYVLIQDNGIDGVLIPDNDTESITNDHKQPTFVIRMQKLITHLTGGLPEAQCFD